MKLCTNLQTRVLDLEKTKTIQAEEIVTRVESSGDEESLGEDSSKQGRINAIDIDEDITLVNDQDDDNMFDVNTLTGDEVLAEPEVVVKDVNLTVDEVTLAQALATLKSVKPKVKAIVVEEPSVPVSAASTKVSAATTTITATILTPRKGIGITELDTSTTTTTIYSQPSQEKFDKEERLAREKDEANVTLTEEWDDIQAKLVEESSKKAETELEKNLKKTKAEVMEGSSKRAGEELEQESIKKQKMDEDKETTELQSLIEVIPDEEEVAIDVVPLATKPLTIVDWKIHKEGKKSYYQIIKADGKSQMRFLKAWIDPHVKDHDRRIKMITMCWSGRNLSGLSQPCMMEVLSSQHATNPVIDDEKTLILEELNRLSEDFGKRFVPKQELSDEQAFWYQTSHPNTDQSASSPVKIEAP
ncbi:hypothetical protein Tco_1215335 [Tanacetum coccineum]